MLERPFEAVLMEPFLLFSRGDPEEEEWRREADQLIWDKEENIVVSRDYPLLLSA